MSIITEIETFDIRFPTSRDLDGSDAMNPDPDYSAAYLVIRTDATDGHEGHGFVFTIGRGNEVETAAINALRGHILGADVETLLEDMGATWKLLAHDSQLRWLGPAKGVMHMAIGAVVNALWLLAGLIRRGSYKPEPGWGKFILQVAAGTLVLAALLAWGSYYFDWIGLRAHRLQRIGLLAALIAGAGLLYYAVLAAVGVRLRSFMRR